MKNWVCFYRIVHLWCCLLTVFACCHVNKTNISNQNAAKRTEGLPPSFPNSTAIVSMVLQIVDQLKWMNVIVLYHPLFVSSVSVLTLELQSTVAMKPVYIEIYPIDFSSERNAVSLLHKIHQISFPVLQFVVIADYAMAFQLLTWVDKLDDSLNRTTDFGHQSFWIVACEGICLPPTTTLQGVRYLENVVMVTLEQTCKYMFQLITITNGRRRFTRDVYNVTRKRNILQSVFPNTQYGFNNRNLVVGSIEHGPFLMKSPDGKLKGYMIDIIEGLAKALNFSVRMAYPTDNSWGNLVNGSWDGMVGQLQRREVDLVVASLTIHQDRETVMDFLYPPIFSKADDIMYRLHDDADEHWKAYFKPFQELVFLLLFGTLVVLSLLTTLLYYREGHYSETRNKQKYGALLFAEVLLHLYGTALLKGTLRHPVTAALRLLLFAWGIFSVIMVAIYSANLVAMFAVQKENIPFRSLHELVTQDDYKWGLVSGDIREHIFRMSKSGDMKLAWDGILRWNQTDPTVLGRDESAHVAKVKDEKYASFLTAWVIERARLQDCRIRAVGQAIIWHQYGVGVPTGSPLARDIEHALSWMADEGLFDVWWRRWNPVKDTHCNVDKTTLYILTLTDVQSAFYVMCLGLTASAIVLVLEKLCHNSF